MSREEHERQAADDFVSEHGTGTSPAQVHAREQAEQERERIALSAQVLRVMMEEQVALYRIAAERAGETDAWTEKWIGHDGKPFGKSQSQIDARRQRAEQFREDAAIHRRRADALADGISAITGRKVDWFEEEQHGG